MQNTTVTQINKILEANKNLKGFSNYMGEVSLNTVKVYLNVVKRFLGFCNKKAEDVDFDDYVGYMNEMRSKTSSYQIEVYSALKKFSTYMYVSGKANRNLMEGIQRPKPVESLKTRQKREKGFLTKKEIEYVLDNIREAEGIKEPEIWKNRDMAIILIFLNTGMRCSALRSLNVNSIDYETGAIRVLDKGSKYHEFLLTDRTLKQVKKWVEIRKQKAKEDEDALFINKYGNRISNNGISEIVSKYAQIDGKKITPHKLRATFGTMMFEKTGDLYFVQQCMGHSNPKTTELYIRGQENKTKLKAREILSEIY